MDTDLEEFLILEVGVVEFLVLLQTFLELLVLNGEVINDSTEV